MEFSIIAAVATDGAIGQEGRLPWGTIKADMRWFKSITQARDPEEMANIFLDGAYVLINTEKSNNAIIVGHRTRNLLSSPLMGRQMIMLSRHEDVNWQPPIEEPPETIVTRNLDYAIELAQRVSVRNIFVCGGAQVYNEALQHQELARLYITEIDAEYPDADTWWPGTVEDLLWVDGVMYCPSKPRYAWQPWRRVKTSPWIETPSHPRIRFGIWERS